MYNSEYFFVPTLIPSPLGVEVFKDAFLTGDMDLDEVKKVRALCSEEAADTKPSLSVRLMLASAGVATQLVWDGLFLMGTHCRVSRYRQRRGRRPRPD